VTPRATYRVQLHKGFPFERVARLAPYLADLGISHLYSSPILQARAGSMHGYDVVDFSRINPELGGEEGFRAMARALRRHGIGIILDIVPNHMAVGGGDNPYWLDVLENGRDSRYANWFDIDFDAPEAFLRGKVLVPFLTTSYADALRGGEISLVRAGKTGRYAIAYAHHRFPIRPQDQPAIEARGVAAFAEPEALDALLRNQHFQLAWWRTAGDLINYRRFFDITELAGIRVEQPEAFEATHRVVFSLYEEGLLDGFRIDHVDGLTDPHGYLATLRDRLEELRPRLPAGCNASPAWLVVEKILAPRETLPETWPVAGTTGYEFMDEVSALQHDSAAAIPLAAFWARLSGRSACFADEERAARADLLRVNFAGQFRSVVDAFDQLVGRARRERDVTRSSLDRVLSVLIRHFERYRGYATGTEDSPGGGPALEVAAAAARDGLPLDADALDFILAVMASRRNDADERRAIRRFNQLTAPVAAKSVEDTSFYRYGRLLSRNEVGSDPGDFAFDPASFHARMRERARRSPDAMLATATHDHKRGEDARARLAVLGECRRDWMRACTDWFRLNASIRPPGLAAGDEYMLYQTLVGAWPLDLAVADAPALAAFRDRIAAWQLKALREAKLRTNWLAPDKANEAAARAFTDALLDPGCSAAFLGAFTAFMRRIAPAGAMNGLVQSALRCLCPGVPDLYQGRELWDFSLVDPDNRSPVDFDRRRVALAQPGGPSGAVATWRDGTVKLQMVAALLRLRRDLPALFRHGNYEPLQVVGPRRHHVLAFRRSWRDTHLVVVGARSCLDALDERTLAPPPEWWQGTRLRLSRRLCGWTSVLRAGNGGETTLGDILSGFPVGVGVVRGESW